MPVHIDNFNTIQQELKSFNAELVIASKTKPEDDIMALYNEGQRIFGENYVQELVKKQEALPKDIQWHFIGHLQRNKVKYIASFISMIHGIDNRKLLKEISKEGRKNNRVINGLLQVHIARETTKFGLDETEVMALLEDVTSHPKDFEHIRLCGFMGMATNTDDPEVIKSEFHTLRALRDQVNSKYQSKLPHFSALSMGMSSDYKIALEEGGTLVRIGSLIMGARDYSSAR